MKRIALLALAVVILFSACKKENNRSSYYVKFTANGTTRTFTGHVGAHIDNSGGYQMLTVLGADNSSSFDNYIGFYLDNHPSATPIGTGQYNDISNNYTLLATYEVPGYSYEAGETLVEHSISQGVTIPNRFKVIITSMDSETIRGTFSGDYFHDADPASPHKMTVTGGEFYVKFQ